MRRIRMFSSVLLLFIFSSCMLFSSSSYRGFFFDTLETEDGAIHYAIFVPSSYDGTKAYSLFISLPGYEGLYFQGIGENLRNEDFVFEAMRYDEQMIIVSPQLMDWGMRSALDTITLTEYLLSSFNIDKDRVFLEGFSGGGETGSIVMGLRPDLYTAFLAVSTRWDGDLSVLAESETPVYMAVGENDSYYGSSPLKRAYGELYSIYEEMGLDNERIGELLVLDVRADDFFSSHGYTDQHAGGNAFSFDESVMTWLFRDRK